MKKLVIAAMTALFAMTGMALAQDVAGDWSIMISAPEGSTSFPMTIAVDGETATGTVDSDELTGTYIDGELKLEGDLYIAEAGYPAKANMTAKLDGESLTGSMSWDAFYLDVIGSRR